MSQIIKNPFQIEFRVLFYVEHRINSEAQLEHQDSERAEEAFQILDQVRWKKPFGDAEEPNLVMKQEDMSV